MNVLNKVKSLKGLLPPTTVPFYKNPLTIVKGEMQYLWDAQGKKYLDMIGGIVTVSVGHCHPRVNDALKKQLDKLWHTTCIYYTEPVLDYAKMLTDTLPDHLKVCFFVNSGSEANDLALALARVHTGRYGVLTLRNAYHGLTQTLQGATGVGIYRQSMPAGFGILKGPTPDPYRGPWGGSNCRDSLVQPKRECNCSKNDCQAGQRYMSEFEKILKYDFPVASGPAAVLIEPIQGIGGAVQFPRGFVKKLFNAVHERGGLCISDEVQTGLGRLGTHFWGFQSVEAKPDIVTMAKGIANGFPMGAVVTTSQIAQSFAKAAYFNTFGGNPLATTAAKAVLEVISEEKLQENCATTGKYLLEELSRVDSPFLGDIRGKGLMIGLEVVDENGEPLDKARMNEVFEETKNEGVLFGRGGYEGNVLRVKPPMCVTKKDMDQVIDAIQKALKKIKG